MVSSDSLSARHFVFSAEVDSVRVARRAVAQFCSDAHLSVECAEIAQLCVSELMTNAVTAAITTEVQLSIAHRQQRLVISVSNEAGDVELRDLAQVSLPAPTATSGRGLAIVRRLAHDVRITRAAGRITVVADLVTS